MEYKISTLVLTIAVFIVYLLTIYVKYGLLPSISESFYKLPNNRKWLFTIFIWYISIMIMLIGGTNLFFLSGIGIMFVATFPYFIEQRWQHYISAMIGISVGILALGIDFGLYYLYLVWIIPSIILIISELKTRILWIEILAFITIIIGLLIHYK